MKKDLLKKIAIYLVIIITFIILAFVYCSPILDGKIISAGDTKSWQGMYQENKVYNEETGNYSWWTGSMFSGMPTYQIGGGKIASGQYFAPISMITSLGITQFSLIIGVIVLYFFGFFILMRSFKINIWLSMIGSIAITLSSYFFIIIAAGHNAKALSIGLMAPVIAGFYLIYNRKYIWGAILTMVYVAVGLMAHPQMSYYICMLIGVLFFAELYIHVKEKRWKDLGISTLIFAVSFMVGIGTGYTKMQLNLEYVKETMRGGHSELVKTTDTTNKTSGLDLDYATQWSYGINETMTLLIPNYMGGASDYEVGTDSEIFKTLKKNGVPQSRAKELCKNVPTYWGDQPFTSGPVYIGAIVFFLFVLGLIIVKGPYKWALLVATLFSILLSWGKNFMPLTELFFNYFPMYDKFRAVSSILIVAEITMPLLGFLAIKEMMDKKITKEKMIKSIYISAGVTAGICLIFAMFGNLFFNFTSPNDSQYAESIPEWLMTTIVAERASMFRMSALRSCIFILLGAGTIWLYAKEKIKFGYFVSILGILILIDMWTVDKKYFNDSNFVTPKEDKSYFAKQPYEEQILQDKDPHFRVLNLSTNTFNESRTSYYLKSIGGYHAAKLRRYQDMIEIHIQKEMQTAYSSIAQAQGNMQMVNPKGFDILNMLNTKYFILPTNDQQAVPIQNPYYFGNAWFVDSLIVVNTPNEEIYALDSINLRNSAVLDAKYKDFTKDFIPGHDSTATVKLTQYAPDFIEYDASASKPGTLVFSEIYYPYGWHAYIDGKPAEHFRVNYTLRALNIPAGNHHIRFEFRPDAIKKSEPISYTCIFIIYATIIGGIAYSIVEARKKKKIS